jgi:hypothetical protein
MGTIIPTRQRNKRDWMKNLSAVIVANAAAYNVTPLQAGSLESAVTLFSDALDVVLDPSKKTTTTVAAKNTAEANAEALCKVMIGAIRPNPDISDELKLAAGIPPEVKPMPVPPPSQRPAVEIVSVAGRTVKIAIHDSGSGTRKRKAVGAASAQVYSYVGETYPSDPSLWQFAGQATRSGYEIVFPDSVAAGAVIWVCAAWSNRRGETGPVSVPISTNVQGGGVNSPSLKIAA